MRIIVAEDRAAASECAADVVERFVRDQQRARLGVATGRTTESLYGELARRHRREGLSFAGVDVYLLDEYVGLDPGDPRRFCSVVQRELAQQVDLRRGAVHCLDPDAPDLARECCRYEHVVRSAPIGLQILGIGSNGHLAFNEPGSALDSITRIVTLSEQTRSDNAAFFTDSGFVPERAITQGISTILAAAELLLLACGERKAAAVASAVHGPPCGTVPASALQLHASATIVLDPDAASLL
ncbi:glucosamine-6-phosphate deaminase [Candidatus Poriferisodalis sp.]|uniref:glucosamine-6-phosphate deaminase n=1 Tax=Candidatus Poriferisodalis sp. TaxID=3101277 RepID=UPI003AF6C06C